MEQESEIQQEKETPKPAFGSQEKKVSKKPSKSVNDSRPEATVQRKLKDMANDSPQAMRLSSFHDIANNKPQVKQTAQLQSIQKQKNKTGLPDNLKLGMENLSGISLDDVQVHRNSDKPAQLQAHAYAQGTDIHLGPGQDKHLPHELGHVVQQKQGRVRPTLQMKGKVNVNDDALLEKEADAMGEKALQLKSENLNLTNITPDSTSVLQLAPEGSNTPLSEKEGKSIENSTENGDNAVMEEGVVEQVTKALQQDKDSNYEKIVDIVLEKVSKKRTILLRIEHFTGSLRNFKVHSSLSKELDTARKIIMEVESEIFKSLETFYELPAEKGEEIGKALATINGSDQKLIESGSVLVAKLKDFAHAAADSGDANYSSIFIKEAQDLETLNKVQYEATFENLEAKKSDGIVGKLEWADRVNNVAGVASGIEGLLVATGLVTTSLSTVASWLGFIFGGAGVLFGLIGTGLAIWGAVTGFLSLEKLKKIAPSITDAELKEAAEYAKTKAEKRTVMSSVEIVMGLSAVAAGILGIIAVNVATLGIPGAALGIAAASIGLGAVLTKYVYRKKKKSRQLKTWAESIVDDLAWQDGQAPTEGALDISDKLKLGSLNPKDPKDRKVMIGKIVKGIGSDFKSKRQTHSEAIIKALLSEKVEEQFQAERIIKGLRHDPISIRSKITESDDGKAEASKQVSVIMDSMQSWAD